MLKLFPLLALCCVAWAAELNIDPREIKITGTIDDDHQQYLVKLKNNSLRSLTIREVGGGCGCITTVVNKKVLLPGEETQLDIEFEFRDYAGQQNKRINLVYRLDGAESDAKEIINITGVVPTGLTFSTKALVWLSDAECVAKKIEVVYSNEVDPASITFEGLEANKFIKVSLEHVQDMHKWIVTAVPLTTKLEEIYPTEKKELQQGFVVSYRTKTKGTLRYEKYFAAVFKKHSPDEKQQEINVQAVQQKRLGLVGNWSESVGGEKAISLSLKSDGSCEYLAQDKNTDGIANIKKMGKWMYYGDTKAVVINLSKSGDNEPLIVLKYVQSEGVETLLLNVGDKSKILSKGK